MTDEIPKYYLKYLQGRSNTIVNGLPLYGIEESKSESYYDLNSANRLFSFLCPEFSKDYLVIRFFENLALLIRKKSNKIEDGDLFEINLEDSTNQLIKLNIPFNEYIRKTSKWDNKRNETLQRIEKLIIENEHKNKAYDRTSKKSKIPFKARDWKVIRSAVHDVIVALVAFRYNERRNAMDVAAFLVTDHPNYEYGHGIKAALNMLFSATYKSGSSFELRFVNDLYREKRAQIPDTIIEFAKKCNVHLSKTKSMISHEEGLTIYSYVSGVRSGLEKTLISTQTTNEISLQGLCFLSNLRIWEPHEIKFVLENASTPEGLLFGKDRPENWSLFEVSLQYGRNIIAVTKFRNSLENLLEEIKGKSIINSVEDYFTIKISQPVVVDTTIKEESKKIEADQEYILLPRIRRFYLQIDIDDDLEYTKFFNQKKRAIPILIYTTEVKSNSQLLNKLKSQTNVIVVVLPLIANELDDEVIKRMKRAKSLRT